MTRLVTIPLFPAPSYLVIGDSPILVDCGSEGHAESIVAALRAEGIEPRDLKLILHTHGHSDHCGASAKLRELSGAPTAIHAADAEMLTQGFNRPLQPVYFISRLLLTFAGGTYPRCEADNTFTGNFDLRPYGVAGEVIETPGHTAGSVSVLLDSGDAIAGDLIMGGPLNGWLFAGSPINHYVAEDPAQIRPSLEKLLAKNPRRLHLGHGGPVEAEDVRRAFSL